MGILRLWCIAFVLLGQNAAAEPTPGLAERYFYAGNLGTHRVYANLEISGHGHKVTGEYAYRGIPYGFEDRLGLDGTLSPDGKIEMTEIPSDAKGPDITGQFFGQVNAEHTVITGQWTNEGANVHYSDGRASVRLPFSLKAYARIDSFGDNPRDTISTLEFLDKKLEIAAYAEKAIRADARRTIDRMKKAGRRPCCEYTPTYYSDRLVSVVFVTNRADGTVHEPLIFGYKDGRLTQFKMEELLRGGIDWPERIRRLVQKYKVPGIGCPFQLRGVAVANAGSLRLFLGCRPDSETGAEWDLGISSPDALELIDPQGPLAGIVKPPAKRR